MLLPHTVLHLQPRLLLANSTGLTLDLSLKNLQKTREDLCLRLHGNLQDKTCRTSMYEFLFSNDLLNLPIFRTQQYANLVQIRIPSYWEQFKLPHRLEGILTNAFSNNLMPSASIAAGGKSFDKPLPLQWFRIVEARKTSLRDFPV